MINDMAHDTLVLTELIEGAQLEQTITMIDDRIVMERCLPHLYIKGSPSGELTMSVRKGIGVNDPIVWSCSQPLSEIISKTGRSLETYHGDISFLDKPLILTKGDDKYTFILSSSNYIYDPDHHVAWVRLRDDRTSLIFKYPYSLKITEIRTY